MVVGFNHNFRYKGVVYHVQTEDGGLKSPNIITLLYRGGNILASKKTSYADITRVDNLERTVEALMKDQHREMLRRLKDGELDSLLGLTAVAATEKPSLPKTSEADRPSQRPAGQKPAVAPVPAATRPPGGKEPKPATTTAAGRNRAAVGASLDEVILSYLAGEEDDKAQ
jgi:hypothetical protein